MFVGREAELSFLRERYEAQGGQLIVLYGRRRVGKTETLREFCRGKPHVFYSCTLSPDKLQLQSFSRALFREDLPAKKYISEFADWEQALRSIADLPFGQAKKLIVIDEFPYMCRGNPGIPSVLQNLWDSELKDKNVMIILCGSSMSFIEKDLLAEKNPLYGRATGIWRMCPMGFYDAARFFPGYSARDKIFAYAVLGGIPHYLRQWNPSLSVGENIKRNILAKGCALYNEVEFLLHQELRETPNYNAIIAAVAAGSTKLGEISQKALQENTAKTSVYLRNLMELGIVERFFSVDAGIKDQGNASRGIYRLTDNYFRFWYAFGFPNVSQLENGDADGVFEYAVRPALHEFVASVFEDVCREFVQKKQKEKALPFRYARMGCWMGKTTVRDAGAPGGMRTAQTEIDLLAVDRNDGEYLVGECKFKGRPFSYAEYLDTLAKLSSLKERAKFHYALFSESGFEQKIVSEAGKNRTLLYGLDEIVSG